MSDRGVKIACRPGAVMVEVEGSGPFWMAPEHAARLLDTLSRAIATASGNATPPASPDGIADRVLATRKGFALAMAQLVGSDQLSDLEVSKVVKVAGPGYVAATPSQMNGREEGFLAAADRAFETMERVVADGGKMLEIVGAGPPRGEG